MKRLVIVFAALLLIAGCAKEQEKKGEYVIKINETVLTKEDVQKEMSTLPPMAQAMFQGPEGTNRFVEELVNRELLFAEAKKRGLDNNEDYKKKLENYKKFSLMSLLVEKELDSASKVSDEDMKAYYEKHKADFMDKSQVRISQIVVKNEDDARKVYDRLKNGEDFGKVAQELSIDKSTAKTGGDMGWVKKGEVNPQLERVIMGLQKDQVSPPVGLKDGIHILKLTDAKGTVADFDKVKSAINQRLVSEKQRETIEKLLESLRKSYKVDINKDAVAKLGAPAAQTAPESAPREAPKDVPKDAPKK